MDNTTTTTPAGTSPAAADAGRVALLRAPYLFKALAAVAPAMSSDASRYILNGIYLELRAATGLLSVVATDGRRLHAVQIKTDNRARLADASAIISAATVKQWLAFAPLRKKEKKGEVRLCSISFDGLTVKLETPEGCLSSRASDGNYPNFRQVIPKTDDPLSIPFETLRTGLADYDAALSGALAAGLAAVDREGVEGAFYPAQIERLEKKVKKETRDNLEKVCNGHSIFLRLTGSTYQATAPAFVVFNAGRLCAGRGSTFDRKDKPREATAAAFNPDYFADFVKAAETINGPALARAWTLKMRDAKHPAAFVCGLDDVGAQDLGAAFVIMPQRIM